MNYIQYFAEILVGGVGVFVYEFFFFQAEDGIRDLTVTGVQTCALPILRENVLSALIYPTILVFVAVASILVLLVFVVPTFQQTFAQAGKALPLPTQIVILDRKSVV